MRFPWQKQAEEYLEEEGKVRKKETLKDTATKIMQRQMKKDQAYGLKASERILGVAEKDENKSLAAQLKEHRELQKTLQDLGGGGGQGWLKDIGAGMASAIMPYLGEILQNLTAKQPQPQLGQQPALQQAQPQVAPQEAPKAEEAPETEPETQFSLEHINSVLSLSPKQAVFRLKEYNPEWLTLIAEYDYESFIESVKLWQKTQLTEPLITELLSHNRREWVEGLISEAKQAVEGQ